MLFNLKIGRDEEDTLSSLSHQLVDKVITSFTYKRHPGFITVHFDMQKKDIHSIPESVDIHEFERIRTERNEMMAKVDKLMKDLTSKDNKINKLENQINEELPELKEELRLTKGRLYNYKHQCKELRSRNKELESGKKELDLTKTIWEGGNVLPVTNISGACEDS